MRSITIHRYTAGFFLYISAVCCSPNHSKTVPTDTMETGNDSESASDSADSETTYIRPAIFEKYGNITTVAGKCAIDEKGVNGWDVAYEGGSATTAELSRPHYAMADSAGNIYIADKDAHAIRMIAGDGTIHTVAGTGISGDGPDDATAATESALSSPNGLWVLGDGTLYILDLDNSKIRIRTPDGQMSTLFTDASGISLGRAIWMSDDESVCYYSSGSAVKKWTRQTGVTVLASGFQGLGALMMTPDGALLVTDRVGNVVYRVSENGTKTIVAGTGTATASGGTGLPATETTLEGVRGVWVLEDGDFFLATHEGSQVWYVDTAGIIHLFVDGAANDAHGGDGGPFDSPDATVSEVRGIACDHSGNLIITENDCGIIRVVERIVD